MLASGDDYNLRIQAYKSAFCMVYKAHSQALHNTPRMEQRKMGDMLLVLGKNTKEEGRCKILDA